MSDAAADNTMAHVTMIVPPELLPLRLFHGETLQDTRSNIDRVRGSLVLAKDIVVVDYPRIASNIRKKGVRQPLYLRDGMLILAEDLLRQEHSNAVVFFDLSAVQFNIAHGGSAFSPLQSRQGVDLQLQSSVRCPDVSYWLNSGTIPYVVVEVADHQDVDDLCLACRDYITDPHRGIDTVIAVKVFDPVSGSIDACPMVAIVYRKESGSIPVDIVSFGTSALNEADRHEVIEYTEAPERIYRGVGSILADLPCRSQDIPEYRLLVNSVAAKGNVTVNSFTDNTEIKLQLEPSSNDWCVDLYELQRCIIAGLIVSGRAS